MIGAGRPAHEPDAGRTPPVQPGGVAFLGIAKAFRKGGRLIEAVREISLSVAEGELLAVLGPSGCGKSTLLNMAAGLMTPSAGRVLYHGREVSGVVRGIGYMTQHDSLIPWRTAGRNVEMPLEIAGHGAAERRAAVERQLAMVGLTGFANHYPNELSGGMRKRVALARTLIYEPKMLLMDEPFGAIDAQTKVVLQSEFLSIWRMSRPTVIFVTHDLHEAIVLADRIAVISRSPGTVVADLKVPFERPRDVLGLASDPQYGALYRQLWELLGSPDAKRTVQ